MYEEVKKLVLELCAEQGTPGDEHEVFKIAEEALSFCDEVKSDPICGVVGFIGNKNAERKIMLDAHIDQIGMVITEIDDKGFLHVTNVGGIDIRTLPGSRVTVYGKEPITGIVCCLPPHISGKVEKIDATEDQAIDIGLTKEEAEKLVSIGDRVVLTRKADMLLGNRVAGTALDDRTGCAAIIRAAQLLKGIKLDNCGVYVCCSTKEEIGGQGAHIMSARIEPTEAIAVDVSFAKQPGTDKLTAELGKGPMIGFSAILDRAMGDKLIELSKSSNIPYQLEAMGGRTGTNCDDIFVSGKGVRCTLISIPQRNMHTPSEVCDLEDIENIAKLIALYIMAK